MKRRAKRQDTSSSSSSDESDSSLLGTMKRRAKRQDTSSSSDESDSTTESLKKILRRPIDPKVVSPYVHCVEVNLSKPPPFVVWYDDTPGKRPTYLLKKITNFESLYALGEETFNNIRGNIRPKDVGKLMLLAFNLVNNDNVRIFGKVSPRLVDTEDIEDFEGMNAYGCISSADVGKPRFRIVPTAQSDVRMRAIGYCYLAASYLRVYTKPVENYIFISNHLKNRFEDFYSFPFPFTSFHPDKATVEAIKSVFVVNERLRNTFYNFIYAGEVEPIGRNIKDFLYASHIVLMGFKVYELFLKCMSAYNVNNVQLSDALKQNSGAYFRYELEAISFIFDRLIGGNGKGKTAQMWRFSRIFDSNYLSQLQAKKCIVFICTLANLYTMGSTKSSDGNAGNVMNILQVKSANRHHKKLADSIARKTRGVIDPNNKLVDQEPIPEAMKVLSRKRKDRV